MEASGEDRSLFRAAREALRSDARKRNTRILETPSGFALVTFFSARRAWITVYDRNGWPKQRLIRWGTRGEKSLERALRRAGFEPAAARERADRISDDWGEPIADVSRAVIPGLLSLAVIAIGIISIGRWLARQVRRPRRLAS